MDFAERSRKADSIKKLIDESFHRYGKQNPESDLTFQDILMIRKSIENEFGGKCPRAIDGALDVAAGLLHPNKIRAITFLKNGMSTILVSGGGAALLASIIYIISYGLTATTVTGILWWKSTAVTILLGGPIGIALGVASLASGIFLMSKTATTKKRTATAQEILIKALKTWVKKKCRMEFDASLVKILSKKEYHSFLFLLYHLAEVDDIIRPEEASMIDYIKSQRKITSKITLDELDLNKCIEMIAASEHAKQCIDLLEDLANIDGEYHYDEKDLIDTLYATALECEEIRASCPEPEKAKFKLPNLAPNWREASALIRRSKETETTGDLLAE